MLGGSPYYSYNQAHLVSPITRPTSNEFSDVVQYSVECLCHGPAQMHNLYKKHLQITKAGEHPSTGMWAGIIREREDVNRLILARAFQERLNQNP